MKNIDMRNTKYIYCEFVVIIIALRRNIDAFKILINDFIF